MRSNSYFPNRGGEWIFARTSLRALTILFVLSLSALSIFILWMQADRDTASAITTVPTRMNFQGRLTDSTGNIKPNGTYNMRFKLYTVSTAGTAVWSEDRLVSASQGVALTNGLFSVQLGSVTPIPDSLFASGSLYLEVELPSPATATSSSPSWTEGAMTPRNQMATSAYAYNAETLDGLDSASFGQLGTNNTWTNTNTFNGASYFGGVGILGTFTAANTSLFKNSTDSVAAFDVQNASGGSLLKVDTTGAGNVTVFENDSAAIAPWVTGQSLPAAAFGAATVSANGFIYTMGGTTTPGGAAVTSVYSTKIAADGSLSAWTTTTALPAARYEAASVVSNGYVYAIGGESGGVAQTSVYISKLNGDGTVGTWRNSNNVLPAARTSASAIVANGYIYVIGGSSGGVAQSTVYYAKLNPDGEVGTWATTTGLPGVREGAVANIANGYLYVISGSTGSGGWQSTAYYAKINVNGTLGTWATTTALPSTLMQATSVIANGYIYVLGGTTGGAGRSTIYAAPLNPSGTIGAWSTLSRTLVAKRYNHTSVVANGYVYYMGGSDDTSAQSTVYYASAGSRLLVGGSLDLVGLQGGTLNEGGDFSTGSVGGTLTAGNVIAVGGLQVQGASTFANDVSIAGNLSAFNMNVSGPARSGGFGQLSLQGSTAGISNQSYMAFTDSDGSRIGYVGDGSTATTDIRVQSDSGNVILSGTQILAANDGTNTSPAYSFSNYSGAGMWITNANELALGTSSTARLVLDGSSAQIWMGTTQRAQRMCHNRGDAPATAGLAVIGDCSTGGSDFAEYYGSPGNVPLGTIVQYDTSKPIEYLPDPTEPGRMGNKAFVRTATERSKALGIHSTNPYVDVLGKEYYVAGDNIIPVGLAGRAPVRVNDSNGSINVGDPVALSDTPGVGAKAVSPGQIVGYAMQDYSGGTEGTVMVLISTGYWAPSDTDMLQGQSGTFEMLTVSGSANIGSLTVTGSAQVRGDLKVVGTLETATLRINEHVVGNSDTRGEVTVRAGATEGAIVFSKPYGQKPFVVVSPVTGSVLYRLSITKDGFKVLLDNAPTEDVTFNYMVQE